MPLDVVHADGVHHAGDLGHVAHVAEQDGEVGDEPAIALEVRVVHGVESHQRGEQPQIGLGESVACEPAPFTQNCLDVGEAPLEIGHRLVVCRLG